jgi:cobalt-zinc-cadmium efflux system membrane fusion protein
VVTEVRKNWGDAVQKGETLAILDSRELGALKASYLASVERRSLAKALFERETRLWKKKITSEQEYLNAKRNFADANITYREKRQALIVLGVPPKHIDNARLSDDNSLTRYEITAPFAGIVIDKHLALGEAVEANSTVFQIGDLREVWANLSVYQKDLDKVRKGTFVIVAGHDNTPEGKGEITYVQPVLGEQTRTAIARVTLDNSQGKWRPGLFIEGKIAIDSLDVPLAVTPGALQKKDGDMVVFVEEKEGLLTPHKVVTGRRDDIHVEIVSGLSVGESYVSEGSFVVKAESEKESFGGEGHHH